MSFSVSDKKKPFRTKMPLFTKMIRRQHVTPIRSSLHGFTQKSLLQAA